MYVLSHLKQPNNRFGFPKSRNICYRDRKETRYFFLKYTLTDMLLPRTGAHTVVSTKPLSSEILLGMPAISQ